MTLVLATVAVAWLMTMFAGGSARADVLFVIVVRVAAIAGICLLVLNVPTNRFRPLRAPLIFMGLLVLAVGIQLIPLPRGLWASLPGRAPYDALSSVPEIGAVWRPISLSPDLTWNALLALLPPLFFLCAGAALHRRERNWLMIALLMTIGFSAVLGLFQLAGGPTSDLRWYPVTNVDSATGFFANRNHQAIFLTMGIPLATWWALRGQGRSKLAPRFAIAAAIILFLFVAVVTTKSRMGLAVAALSLLLSAGYVLRRIKIRAKILLWLTGAAAACGLLVVLALAGGATNRLSAHSVQDDLRVRIFPESLQAAKTFFPVGSGYGAFANVFRRFESDADLAPTYVNHTHSEPTQIVIEGGVVSIVLLALFLIWFGWAAIRVWRKAGTSEQADLGRLASILVFLPLIASTSDYPIRAPLMACTLAFAAAVLHLGARASTGSGRQGP